MVEQADKLFRFVPVYRKIRPNGGVLKIRVRDVIDASERINNEELMLELTEKIDLKLNEKDETCVNRIKTLKPYRYIHKKL